VSEIFLFISHFAIVFLFICSLHRQIEWLLAAFVMLFFISVRFHLSVMLSSFNVQLCNSTVHVLWFDRQKGNELCQNGRVMKGLLFTCYHGNNNVQSLIYDGLSVKQSTFNHLGEEYCHGVDFVVLIHLYPLPISHSHIIFCDVS